LWASAASRQADRVSDDGEEVCDAIDQLKEACAAHDPDRVQGVLEMLTSRLAYMYAATAAIDQG
jgi:hypothetical protein